MPASPPKDFTSLIDAAQGEVETLAQHLEALRRMGGSVNPPTAEALARLLYGQRRGRDRFFSAGLFGEPAWDVLLDLYIARCEGRTVSTKSACVGAAVAPSTALRWLQRLEEGKLVRRRRAKGDGRLIMVEITDAAFDQMTAFLRRLGATV